MRSHDQGQHISFINTCCHVDRLTTYLHCGQRFPCPPTGQWAPGYEIPMHVFKHSQGGGKENKKKKYACIISFIREKVKPLSPTHPTADY